MLVYQRVNHWQWYLLRYLLSCEKRKKKHMKGNPAIGHGTPDVLPHKGRIKMIKTHTLKKLEVYCTVWKWVWRTWEDHFTVEVLKHVYTFGI